MEGLILLAIVGFVVYLIIKNAEKVESYPMAGQSNSTCPQQISLPLLLSK